VSAIRLARERLPELRCEIYGDGPERAEVGRRIAESNLEEAVTVRGFVPAEEVQRVLRRALCMVLPSRREGHGLIVVEAAAAGTPSVVVHGPDNAATELVSEDFNGVVAPSASAEDLAAAILRVHQGGPELRARTADWFERNASRLSMSSSLERVLATYAD